MTATTAFTVKELVPNSDLKAVLVYSDNTVDATNTIAITLATYGISTLLFVMGCKHTTDGSVIATEAPTTAVSAGVLTITVPSGTDNDPRVYLLIGLSSTYAFA